jgi:hypothetical protein
MNTLEDRVRAATRAAASTVPPDGVPPLRLPPAEPAGGRRWSSWFGSSWAHRLAPVGAALAVIAVAVIVVVVGRTAREPTSGPGSVVSTPGPMTAGPPVSSYVASGQVPPYYVSIESHGNPNFNPSYAVVRATATGAALGTVPLPPGQTVLAVTAAADDRTFALDEAPWVNPNGNTNQSFEPRTFHLLSLGSSGRIESLGAVPLSVPGGQLMTGFALSPDGSKLAIAVQPDNNKREPDLTEVKVVTLATGAVRTWSANGTVGFGPDDARSLSWADDERTLAFDWIAAGPGVHTGVRVLDTGTGGGNLLADSRQAVTLINQALQAPTPGPTPTGSQFLPVMASVAPSRALPVPTCQEDSIITPDGSAIVCGAIASVDEKEKPNGIGLQRGAVTGFFEYSTATGKVTRILGHWLFGSVGALSVDVLWSNASGSVLIGVIPNSGGGQVGVISGNEFTPLPTATAGEPSDSGTW